MANSYKKTLRGYIFCILLIPSMLMLFSFNSLAEDKIKIGLVCVFSGPFEYGGRYSLLSSLWQTSKTLRGASLARKLRSLLRIAK